MNRSSCTLVLLNCLFLFSIHSTLTTLNFCMKHRDQRFFQLENIINILVSAFRFIWKLMLWVYRHYTCLILSVPGWIEDYRHQILTSKVSPPAERVKLASGNKIVGFKWWKNVSLWPLYWMTYIWTDCLPQIIYYLPETVNTGLVAQGLTYPGMFIDLYYSCYIQREKILCHSKDLSSINLVSSDNGKEDLGRLLFDEVSTLEPELCSQITGEIVVNPWSAEFFYENLGVQRVFSIWNHHNCLSQLFPIFIWKPLLWVYGH